MFHFSSVNTNKASYCLYWHCIVAFCFIKILNNYRHHYLILNIWHCLSTYLKVLLHWMWPQNNIKPYVRLYKRYCKNTAAHAKANTCRSADMEPTPAAQVVLVLEDKRFVCLFVFCFFFNSCCLVHRKCQRVLLTVALWWVVFFLFVNEFDQALAEVIEVKNLDVQNFNDPLNLSIHTIPFLQWAI